MPRPPSNADGPLLPSRTVRERYGVTGRTLDRWMARDNLGFPQPLRINQRRYWYLSDLEDWERKRQGQLLPLSVRHATQR